MSETDDDDPLHLVDSIAEGSPIDWGTVGSEPSLEPSRVRSLELIEAVFRDYGEAADEVRARLRAPLLESDSTWGHLRILAPIASGTYGQVFRAFDRDLERDVALKVFRDPAHKGPGVPECLEEARRLARVKHPGVLIVHGIAEHRGRAGIWTELIQGRSLEDILETDGWFTPDEALRIGTALCSALVAVHAAGLIHRDVKTQNVLRETGGRIVLADFGAMDERFDEDRDRGYGSLLSSAPEILMGSRPTPASDVYAVGALLYRILTGRYPVVGDSPEEVLEGIERGPIPLAVARPGISTELAAAVDRALAPDPARRFVGPKAMEAALLAALQGGGDGAGSGPGSGMWALAVAGAISLSVAVGVTVFLVPWLVQSFRPVPPAPSTSSSRAEATAPRTWPPGLEAEPVLVRVTRAGHEALARNASIGVGDHLVLELQTGSATVHTYVLDEDEAGNHYVLFPLSGLELKNPLPARARLLLPERERLTWLVDSENGAEDVIVITSLQRLEGLDRAIRSWPRARGTRPPGPGQDTQFATRGSRGTEPGDLDASSRTRGMSGLAPRPKRGALAGLLDSLRATSEFRTGVAGMWSTELHGRSRP